MKTKRIFVYGTLMEGFYNYNKFLKGRIINKFSGVSISGKLFHLTNKGYPAVISGDNTVSGEVFDVIDDGKILENIHKMEGFISTKNPNNEYNLEIKKVSFPNGKIEELPVYIYNSIENEIINNNLGVYLSCGDWKSYMNGK